MGTKRGTQKQQPAPASTVLSEAERIDLIADILLELALEGDDDGSNPTT